MARHCEDCPAKSEADAPLMGEAAAVTLAAAAAARGLTPRRLRLLGARHAGVVVDRGSRGRARSALVDLAALDRVLGLAPGCIDPRAAERVLRGLPAVLHECLDDSRLDLLLWASPRDATRILDYLKARIGLVLALELEKLRKSDAPRSAI